MRLHGRLCLSVGVALLAGCSGTAGDESADAGGSETSGDGDPTTGDGDGDPTGDGDGDPTGDGDPSGDGDGDPSSGDGDGDPEPEPEYDCMNPRWDPAEFNYVYDVGPGFEHATPSDLPWEEIYADTLVRIHWRDEPYRDKWVIARSGGGNTPIVVLGVPNPDTGELPHISGDGAVTRPELDYWNEARAVIKIGGANFDDDPGNVHVECLRIGQAKPGYSFTDADGQQQEYAQNAAAIFVERGHDLWLRNNELFDAGNGLFVAWETQTIRVIGNFIHDNGNVDSIYEHNSYTEARGILFEANHYGPLCEGCPGNNLKDRSAGTVIRYNWIEDGNRQLDLVDSDNQAVLDDPRYPITQVYGNVLVEGDGQGNSQIIHYGGDSGDEANYRKGTLLMHHNTVVSTRSGNTTLVRLSSEGESADIRNNVIYVSAAGTSLAITDGSGAASLVGNWLPAGWVPTHGTLTGTVDDLGNLDGAEPGFVDADAQDFHLAGDSVCVDAAAELAADADPVTEQYRAPQATEARPDDGSPDVGAFER